ncbi:MAG: undecaprenyl diphosphate synthase family protein [Methanosarcina thermophila]|mgnify:CR=1 FL=1|jgi:undecaprenyl diphosphate synthase|uniref:Undecaprenyl diphosphate synthase n=3 Tax=Methanosarcina thermophila TaxID=2210 RepID=A0A1I6X1L2_METTE|nr:undecaprenyl diphosphate synthase family protein [Methanosarcina thermophila]ALK04789.1 MAG: UDP diphosphate synthase [Methanosarcina sp. 795]AKB13499.1 Undecaprenyl diphosphate synthase [Methanosarcina thermophila TM-1]AKB15865.1 Undecaprenyl diphosphate synthase [Methanosarcina thermophila CHTI-55]NLU56576.1 undecaprenyl diphosphate synthase family protein [Methanosarcina thermophila]SFT32145.1 undecaprenyl diphosphate synthase [Methanosarcina thermophila]
MDLLSFAYPFYERFLAWQIAKTPSNIPRHVAIILKETDLFDPKGLEKLLSALGIFRKFGVELVSIYVDILKTDLSLKSEIASTLRARLEESFSDLPEGTGYTIYGVDGEVNVTSPGKDFFVYISLGFGGRKEITRAVLTILGKVKAGSVKPEEVDEKMLESHLLVKHEPDIMIRSGGQKLSDFLVWQSVYSELYFTDVNWKDVRRLDLLRVMRDFQKRQRRYGR